MTLHTHRLRLLVLTAAMVPGLAACGNADDTDDTATPAAAASTAALTAEPTTEASAEMDHDAATGTAAGSLQAADQSSDGSTLTVAAVTLTGVEHGFIAVHQDLDGKPGRTVGLARLSHGDTDDLVVTLDKPVTSGAFLPMLHVDDHTIGSYEFPHVPDADLPVKSGDEVVMQKINLTVS